MKTKLDVFGYKKKTLNIWSVSAIIIQIVQVLYNIIIIVDEIVLNQCPIHKKIKGWLYSVFLNELAVELVELRLSVGLRRNTKTEGKILTSIHHKEWPQVQIIIIAIALCNDMATVYTAEHRGVWVSVGITGVCENPSDNGALGRKPIFML